MGQEREVRSRGRTAPATAGNCLQLEYFKAFATQLSHKWHNSVFARSGDLSAYRGVACCACLIGLSLHQVLCWALAGASHFVLI